MKRTSTIAFAIIALLALIAVPPASAAPATWAGGATGNWNSAGVNNWGLGVGVYPGDGSAFDYAIMSSATVSVLTGDTITFNSESTLVNGATLKIEGGTFFTNGRIQIYGTNPEFLQTGGKVTGDADLRLLDGSTANFTGGQYGNRLEVTSDNTRIAFYGSSAVTFAEGAKLQTHTVDYTTMGADDSATLEFQGTVASYLERVTLYLKMDDADAASQKIRFVFSSAGITDLRQLSGNGLTLGSTSALEADVSSCLSDGTTEYVLINYQDNILGTGSFGSVTITDGAFGTLTPGTPGSLNPGEYSLSYTGGDGTGISIFYNTIPEPASMALIGLGGMLLAARRRRR